MNPRGVALLTKNSTIVIVTVIAVLPKVGLEMKRMVPVIKVLQPLDLLETYYRLKIAPSYLEEFIE